jgi:hypothetical protein
MAGFRFSLMGLLATVGFVAIVCGAVTVGSIYLIELVSVVTAVILLGAILSIIYRTGIARAFWIGFAVFGWGSYVLQQSPMKLLAAENFLRDAYPFFRRTTPLPPNAPEPTWVRETDNEGGSQVAVIVRQSDFIRVGKCVYALVFALSGGWMARYFHATRDSARRSDGTAPAH